MCSKKNTRNNSFFLNFFFLLNYAIIIANDYDSLGTHNNEVRVKYRGDYARNLFCQSNIHRPAKYVYVDAFKYVFAFKWTPRISEFPIIPRTEIMGITTVYPIIIQIFGSTVHSPWCCICLLEYLRDFDLESMSLVPAHEVHHRSRSISYIALFPLSLSFLLPHRLHSTVILYISVMLKYVDLIAPFASYWCTRGERSSRPIFFARETFAKEELYSIVVIYRMTECTRLVKRRGIRL